MLLKTKLNSNKSSICLTAVTQQQQSSTTSLQSRIYLSEYQLKQCNLVLGDCVLVISNINNRISNDSQPQYTTAAICTVWNIDQHNNDHTTIYIDSNLIYCTVQHKQQQEQYDIVTASSIHYISQQHYNYVSINITPLTTAHTNDNNIASFNRISVKLVNNTNNSNITQNNLLNVSTQLKSYLYRSYVCNGCYIKHNDNIYQVYDTLPNNTVSVITHQTNIVINIDNNSNQHASNDTNTTNDIAQHNDVNNNTNIQQLNNLQANSISHNKPSIEFTNNALKQLYDMLNLRTNYKKAFEQFNIPYSRGILLYGPPGVGKSYTVRTVCNALNIHVININGSTLNSQTHNNNSNDRNNNNTLQHVFDTAINECDQYPNGIVIFIDEIDMICPRSSNQGITRYNNTTTTMTNEMCRYLDNLSQYNKPITVIGATNYIDSIDLSLRRVNRFHKEIIINVPNQHERYIILKHYTQDMRLHSDVNIQLISQRCIGYVGADIYTLCEQVKLYALQQYLKRKQRNNNNNNNNNNNHNNDNTLIPGLIQQEHFDYVILHMSASSQKGLIVPSVNNDNDNNDNNNYNLSLDSIGGLTDIKQQLQQYIEWPLLHSTTFNRLGITHSKGVLLYGPPGCGKTNLVRAIASSRHTSFIYCDSSSIYNSLLGESEKYIVNIFQRARSNIPAIIFIDEIDSIVSKRGLSNHSTDGDSDSGGSIERRILSVMLSEIDGVNNSSGIMIVGATNRIYAIDDALLRPGRFDSIIYVPPPDVNDRYNILRIHTRHLPLHNDVDLEYIAKCSDMYSGADIQNLIRQAVMYAIKQQQQQQQQQQQYNSAIDTDIHNDNSIIQHVRQDDFLYALNTSKPSITEDMLEQYHRNKL